MTDDEIIKALCDSYSEQVRALKVLYRDKGAAFKHFFKSKGLPQEICEDILQDVIIKIFEAASKYRGIAGNSDNSANAWMWAIARNRMNDYLKLKKSSDVLREIDIKKVTNQLRREQAIKDSKKVGVMTNIPYIEPSNTTLILKDESLNDEVWSESHKNEIKNGEFSLLQDASIRQNQLEIDLCISNGIEDFNSEYPDRAEVLIMQMDGESIESISRRIGRTVAATKEYLSQCRIKLKPFIVNCHQLISP